MLPTIHQSIGTIIEEAFFEWKSREVPKERRLYVRSIHEEENCGFAGRWAGSRKQPDLGISGINGVMKLMGFGSWLLGIPGAAGE